ncbi:hypothetical protein [Sorangium sp. So ce131]|uniref:hypothetical protein n=1 Tax=Sorangium sp. So ce131 TaxID=3133282 RepID=UPI003F5FEDC6
MRDQRAMLPALLVSALVHVGAWRSARLSPQEPARGPAPVPEEREPIDLWTGATAALPGSGSAARPADARAGAEDPGATHTPADAARPDAAPADAAQQRAPAARDAAAGGARAHPRAAAPRRQPAPRPTAAARAGEERRAPATTANAGRQARSAAAQASDDAGEGGEGDFGAAGASAVRSLGRAFTRAIPPACQADPIWATLPLGSAGKARFVIDIDEAGHIASWRPEGEEPPARHLGNLAKRTIALLGGGTFAVSRGAVTSGRQTLEVSAVIHAGADEPTDAPADLAWRFEGSRGEASFAQPGGRQVDVVVQVVRTEVARAAPPG